MDLATFKVQVEKSREFEATLAGVKFLLRLPSEHAWRLSTDDHRDQSGRVLTAKVHRKLLEGSVIGWDGLKAEHILKGAGNEAIPFSRDALGLMLDERQDMADELAAIIARKISERREQQEIVRKN
jgi:hypothetical protein